MANSLSTQEVHDQVLLLLREVIPRQFTNKELRPEMTLQSDLGIDSLGKAALVFLMEEEFGLNFADLASSVGEVRTVEHVLDVAIRLINPAVHP
jgi:acyl carrier protein